VTRLLTWRLRDYQRKAHIAAFWTHYAIHQRIIEHAIRVSGPETLNERSNA
jgi:hypothetical protein